MTRKKQFSTSAYVRRTNDQDVARKISAQHEYRHAPPARKTTGQPLRVLSVDRPSLAERIGLKPGDEVLELNGNPLLDVIDFQFRVAGVGERMSLRTQDRTLRFVRREWEDFGVEFEPIEPLVCDNDCVFCFVHQNPGNTRRSLRIKDEDYRLSFLFGNYLTLTNVAEDELDRIIEQRLSPLYISVHATEPELRTVMLGNTTYDGLDTKLDRLTEAGITLHCQVVLCPGLNDGAHLERTIEDLARRHPGVQSVAVVPLGLTDHRENLPKLDSVTPDYARATIAHVEPVQRHYEDKWDTPFVFLGDEFYILAGQVLPPESHYAEFPQIENGVGMVRTFLDEFDRAIRKFMPPSASRMGTICTGRLFHGHLERCVARFGLDLKTVAVENRFWGSGVNVAGLLTGSDFVRALKGKVHGDFVVLPAESMIGEEYLFLDDLTITEVEEQLGVRVISSGYSAQEFVEVIARETTR